MAAARSRSHAAKAHEEAAEAPEAPEVQEEAAEAPSGISADVAALREAHASLPVIQALDASVEVDQPEVLESLSQERRRLQVEAIETHGLHL